MKSKLTLALVASLTSTAFAAFQAPLPEFKNEKQLAEWRAEKASEATSQGYVAEETAFYTGRPYLASTGGYAFKYRSYSPELARWTSEDPSGFPDGANQNAYACNPTNSFDFMGLWKVVRVSGAEGASAYHEQLTPGGKLRVNAEQQFHTIGGEWFGISSKTSVGQVLYGTASSLISGTVGVSPGGNEIFLNLNAPYQSTSSGLANSSVGIGNITYSDNRKTVSFNLTYGGASSLSGSLSYGAAGVSASGGGYATGFGTVTYTLVE